MMNYLLVALGGALGSVLRYWTSLIFAFPYGTITVNILGSMVIGLAYGLLSEKGFERVSLLLMAGFLGGFTTFSAYSVDSLNLLNEDKIIMFLIYSVLSSVIGILFCYLGMNIVK